MTTKKIKKANALYERVLKTQELPSWFPVPPVREVRNIRAIERGGIWRVVIDEIDGLEFATPVLAWDYIRADTNAYDIRLHKTLNREEWGTLREDAFFAKAEEGQRGSRLIIGNTDQNSYHVLQYAYHEFLQLDKKLKKNPKDWVLAYQWLERHPAFWIYVAPESQDDGTYKLLYWVTESGIDKAWTTVFKKKGKPFIGLEHGIHTEDFRHHYHDTRLDVWGTVHTLEEAYVQFAKNVRKYYNSDGTEKKKYLTK